MMKDGALSSFTLYAAYRISFWGRWTAAGHRPAWSGWCFRDLTISRTDFWCREHYAVWSARAGESIGWRLQRLWSISSRLTRDSRPPRRLPPSPSPSTKSTHARCYLFTYSLTYLFVCFMWSLLTNSLAETQTDRHKYTKIANVYNIQKYRYNWK